MNGQTFVKGERVTKMPPWEKRPKPKPAGRVCEQDGCDTVLSIYNKQLVCFEHQPVRYVMPTVRGRKKKSA